MATTIQSCGSGVGYKGKDNDPKTPEEFQKRQKEQEDRNRAQLLEWQKQEEARRLVEEEKERERRNKEMVDTHKRRPAKSSTVCSRKKNLALKLDLLHLMSLQPWELFSTVEEIRC